jgi:hypothetical protein
MTDRRRAAARALVLATAIAIVLVTLRTLDTLSNGLRGQYFQNSDWSGEPIRTVVDANPSTAALVGAAGANPPASFSVSWSGWIVAPRDDAYTFATTSDDGSWVYVDGQLVVDNGGGHGPTTRTGPTIRLTRGPHAVFIKYFQNGGSVTLEWLWQRGAGAFGPVPSWALRPRRIEFRRFVVDRALEIGRTAALWAWAATLAAALAYAFRPEIDAAAARAAVVRRELARERSWRALLWIVSGSALLNAIGLWWGLPHGVWVGDELIPTVVASGWPQYFSNGWSDKYPPLHFYVLTLAYLPVVVADWIGGLDPALTDTLFAIVGRLVSVVMAAATLVAVFFVGRRAFGARVGLFAAALAALSAPFVYYAKAANVDIPYLLWFTISLVFYLRVLDGGARSDFVGWGVAAACAVCTKDQAYGLYLLTPIPVVIESWRAKRPIAAPLGVAAAAAAVTFALVHNLIFNAAGFAGHVRTILGPASQGYRAYDPTLTGHAALFAATLRLIPQSLGWPATIVCAAGTVVVLSRRSYRRRALWLLVPVVSYYLSFISVVLYNYDRFLMPVFIVMALFGGVALDTLASASSAPVVRRAAVALVFAYTLLYSASVDALMLNDSRYEAERWLAEHAAADDLVATTSIATYMPRTTAFNSIELFDVDTLQEAQPRFVVLNADYTFNEPTDSALGRLMAELRSGAAGYRLVLTLRSPNPLRWLPGGHSDLVGDRRDPEVLSFLRNINPTLEIYQREPR